MDEEVIILSESEPTSEATFGDQSIVEVVTIRSSLRRRRVTLPCPTCGMLNKKKIGETTIFQTDIVIPSFRKT